MAITGDRLLRIVGYDSVEVTNHALERISERTGVSMSREKARQLFLSARQVTFEQLLLLGYRPRYEGRRYRGETSLYFQFTWKNHELIAVLTEDRAEKKLVWVTTYTVSDQTSRYRLFTPDTLPGVSSL